MHIDVSDRDFLLALLAAVAIERIERDSLFAWLRLSRRPSRVCSPIIERADGGVHAVNVEID
jgi:hypothetical protein